VNLDVQQRARDLLDPAGLDAIYEEGGFDALVEVAWHNPNMDVVTALAERVHGRSARWFSAAALAITRFDLDGKRTHLDRALGAPDRSSAIGRSRIESVCRRIEDDWAMRPLFRERLDAERDPAVAKELVWSLVHGDKASRDGCLAIVRAVERFDKPSFRKEAARALSYWDAAVRAPVLRAFLDERPKEERVTLRAFARLIGQPR